MGCKDSSKLQWRKKRHEAARGVVKRKMRKLQRLVPGGSSLQPDQLFLRTAEHILQLRSQINVLQALAKIYKT